MDRHRFDIVSMLFGAIFLTVGLAFVVNPEGGLVLDWAVVAGSLVLAAGAGIVASLVAPARSRPRAPEVALPPPPSRTGSPSGKSPSTQPGVLGDEPVTGPDLFDPFNDIDPEVLAEIERAAEADDWQSSAAGTADEERPGSEAAEGTSGGA